MKLSLIILSLFVGFLNEEPVMLVDIENPIVISNDSYDLSISDQVQIKVSAPSIENPVFSFESDKPKIASVSSTGLVSGLSEGDALIKVSLVVDDKEFISEVKFSVKGVEGDIKLGISEFYLIRGLTYEVPYSLSGSFEGESVSWNSSNRNVASVENGVVHGKEIGQTTISASVNDVSVSFNLFVTVPLTQVSFNPSSISMVVEDVREIPDLVFVPFDATSSRHAVYFSSDESIVRIEEDRLYAVGVGEVLINVSVGSVTSSLNVSVKPKKSDSGADILNLVGQVNKGVLEFSVDSVSEYRSLRYDLRFNYDESLVFDSIKVKLPNALLHNSMSKISSFVLPGEFLNNPIDVSICDMSNKVLLIYHFDSPYEEGVSLKYSLDEISESSTLYPKIGARSYRLDFNVPSNYFFSVDVPAKLIDSKTSQYHFIYEVHKNNVLDTNQAVSVNESGFLRFDVGSNENVISFSRISVRNNSNVIVWMLGLFVIVGLVVGSYYAIFLKKGRNV